ncbi:MAG: hypothetical protein AABY64_14415 [Bdellovibrionota bacterium]
MHFKAKALSKLLTAVCLFRVFTIEAQASQLNSASVFGEVVSQSAIVNAVAFSHPTIQSFIKDAPVYFYVIQSARIEDLPKTIYENLGALDKAKYTPEYLASRIQPGNVVALQVSKGALDLYPISKETFNSKYKVVSATNVIEKNKKLHQELVDSNLGNFITAGVNIIGGLKVEPVKMILMSELGFSIKDCVTIESPYGQQTKPADHDAYLAFHEGRQQYYMINADNNGLPTAYIKAEPRHD